MAKRRSRKAGGKLGDFAERLGSLLGTTERKTNEWLKQGQVPERLRSIRDTADGLLKQFSSEHPFPWKAKTGGVAKKKTAKKTTKPRTRKAARKTARKSGGNEVGNG